MTHEQSLSPNDVLDYNLLENSRINIFGEINEEKAEYVITRLKYLHLSLHKKEIYIYIHSDGGEVDSCCAIVDEILGLKACKVKVYTIAVGKAYSSAAMILAFGSERYATENTSLMLHPVILNCPEDYISQQRNYTKFVDTQWNTLSIALAKVCGYKNKSDIEDFKKHIKDGLWMMAEEAIQFGLIDGIWDYKWEK